LAQVQGEVREQVEGFTVLSCGLSVLRNSGHDNRRATGGDRDH